MIDVNSIVNQITNLLSVVISTVGFALISLFVGIFIISMVKSIFTRTTNYFYSDYENRLREKYKKDGYFGSNHPDHFDYQRKTLGFTYFPNTKKAKRYYREKRKVYYHQRNYKGYKPYRKKKYKRKYY